MLNSYKYEITARQFVEKYWTGKSMEILKWIVDGKLTTEGIKNYRILFKNTTNNETFLKKQRINKNI